MSTKSFSKLYWYVENMSSAKIDICLNILLSNTFDKTGSILIGLLFSFKLLLHFLCMFQAWWKNREFYRIVNTLPNEIWREYSLIILVVISEYWDALSSFNNLNFLKTDLPKTKSTIPVTFSSDHQNARVFFVFKNSF